MFHGGVYGVLREEEGRVVILIRVYDIGVQPYRAVAGGKRNVEADRRDIRGRDQCIILFCEG